MKYLLTFCLVCLLGFSSKSQHESFYGSKWLEVYRLEVKELPKSALEIVDSIYNHAKANNNEEQLIKALIYQSKFALTLEENAELKVVNRFKEEIRQSSNPSRGILQNYLAKIYFEYLQHNRWQLFRRTQTKEKIDTTDFRTWDLQTLLAEVNRQYQLSLKPFEELKKVRGSSYNSLINRFDSVDQYRPTLLDILAHNAIEFYKTGYSGYYTQSAYNFKFDKNHFGDLEKINLPETDTIPELKLLQLCQKLYKYHLSRNDTNAFVKVDLDRLDYVFSQVNQQEYQPNYFKALDHLEKISAGHGATALIDFERANQFYSTGEKPRAMQICDDVLKAYPNTDGAGHCLTLKKHIETKELQVTAEQFVVPQKHAKILVEYKNIDSLYLKIYKLTQQQEVSFTSMLSEYEKAKLLEKLPVFNEKFIRLKDPGDYEQHSTEVAISPMQKGAYVVLLSLKQKASKDIYAYDLMQVTQVALLEATLNNEKRFQVVDRFTGKPVEGARIHVRHNPEASYEGNFDRLLTTGINGFVSLPQGDSYIPILLDVYHDGDSVDFGSSYISQRYKNRSDHDNSDYVTAKAVLFTDRSIYRPGQTLYFKGILLKKRGDETSLLTGEYVEVYFEDVNGDEVGFLRLKVNKYGSFSGEFKIPSHSLTGEYSLYADMDYEEDSKFYDEVMDDFLWNELYINVEEYKRPTFEVSFNSVDKAFSVNDTVSVTGKAESFSGANISNAKVVYSVQRVVQFPPWYGWGRWHYDPPVEITSGETTTDNEGKYEVSFMALPDNEIDKASLPVFNYEITAVVTDINGETHEAKTNVRVGYHQLEAVITVSENIDINQIDKASISYQITNLNGQPVSAKGEITIYELKRPTTPLRERPWPAPDQPVILENEFNKMFPHEPYKNISTWKNWPKGEKVKTFGFDSASAELGLEEASLGVYLAELATTDDKGNEIRAHAYFKIYDFKSDKLADNQLFEIKTDKPVYNIGDNVQLNIGTAAQDMVVVIDIDKGHKIVETHVIHLSDEVKTVAIDVSKSDTEGFAVHYYYAIYNSYQSGTKNIFVNRADENIQIETVTFRDKILPGAEETWAFRVKGTNKERREVEMLASMYDTSLDQFIPHKWSFDPLPKSRYYAYNPNNQNSFRTTRFNLQNTWNSHRYYRKPIDQHSGLNMFGFSLSNKRADQLYLKRLRNYDLQQVSKVNLSMNSDHPKGYVYGTITSAEDGSPLPGVNVLIKGTTTGTVTDLSGQYTIVYEKGDELVFSFIGMTSEVVKPDGQNIVDVQMASDVQQLSEVVVTAYGEVLKSEATAAVAVEEVPDTEMLAGKIPGVDVSAGGVAVQQIRIRGNNSLNGNRLPLYVVDGVIVSESDILAEDLASVEVLKGEAATSLYGAKAVNGVVIIKTKSGQKKTDELLAKVEARKDLRETTFFYPHLETNNKGEITFKFDTPETLTRWKLQLLAHSKELKAGYKSLNTITQKELMVVPNAPRFLRHGDQIELSTKIVNITDQPQQVRVRLSLFDAETNEEITRDLIQLQIMDVQVSAKGGNTVEWSFKVPENFNAILYKIVATNGTYSDGEQKIIPILSDRQLVTETLPMTVKGNSTKQFELTKLINNKSNTLVHHKLTLEITSNPIWYVIKSLPYLMEYPYECSEQTFARLYANLLAKKIVDDNKNIRSVFNRWKSSNALISNPQKNQDLKALLIEETPWLREAKSEEEQQKRIAILFDIDKVSEESEASFNKLYQMQLSSGGFPWFSGNHNPNRYITQHIIAGFGHLEHLGIKPQFLNYDWMIKQGIKHLDKQIIADYKELIADSTSVIDEERQLSDIQVHYLYTRSFFDKEQSEELKKAVDFYTNQSATHWTDFNLLCKAMIALVQFRKGNVAIAHDIITSLEETSILSKEMGMYWKANDGGYRWVDAKIETQALLISAFNEIMSDTSSDKTNIINEMKNWLFKHKQVNQWPTTKATTKAIYAVLLNEDISEAPIKTVKAQIGNQVILSDNIEAGTGYFKEQWDNESIIPELGKVKLSNEGKSPAYGSLYWQYFQDIDAITSASTKAIQLTKKVFKVNRNSQGEILNEVNDSTTLNLGDLLRIRITLKTDRDMEFLHMKDQRAAGLEPTTTLSKYKWQEGLGYYQATKDASTNFFFDRVPKGVYVFEYDLRANNKGSFINGITTIQSMYAPEFMSHTNAIILNIESR
ncbi:alpha-2-macroglobulin [Fulvivirga sp. RKSG066]|uniref:alpha-2-macroglobulin family protein n=1 Tax=Fulvivirga aurantia TaxID=2529383 RepID=UPI0012BCAD18|nr:alpha-2-macroglobulin family protein [Fulvivirga aurantia]MTI22922.1 alpha-2-macroglobulin [Fulvivirga aurantia]